MIKEINIGGQLRPVKFNLNAISSFGKVNNLSYSDIIQLDESRMRIDHLISLTWAGLKEGARLSGQKFDHSLEDVGEWLTDDMTAAFDVFAEYAGVQAPVNTEKKSKAVKGKKQPGTT